jgi:hypothetical protein
MKTTMEERLPIARLALLTTAALAIHGYHLGVEDGEIYIPAAKKLLDPGLYPYATEFFLSHEHLSLFGQILAETARLMHISMDWTIFLWYIVTVLLFMLASWRLVAVCFSTSRARWGSLLLVTAVMTMPATNTGLLLMDPYLTARSFSTPLTLVSLALLLKKRYALATAATLLMFAIHLQMTVYFVGFAAMLWAVQKTAKPARERVPVMAAGVALFPTGFPLQPAQDPYREALYARDFYFLSNWTWYHWLGMLAPLAILAWFWRGQLRGTTPEFRRLSCALIPFGMLSILAAAVLASSHFMDTFARLQPLRCFHLITLVFVLLLGGVIGEYAGKRRSWAIAAICLPLAVGMFFVARQTYPYSAHIERAGTGISPNAWVNALLWVRKNTPKDAVFAVDSRYFKDQGVDVHGFRAISERSDLADYFKDGGVVALFPDLAPEWKQMSNLTYGLNHFSATDFARLAREYPVTWTVIHGPAPPGMGCPYRERGYAVCKIQRNSSPASVEERRTGE